MGKINSFSLIESKLVKTITIVYKFNMINNFINLCVLGNEILYLETMIGFGFIKTICIIHKLVNVYVI